MLNILLDEIENNFNFFSLKQKNTVNQNLGKHLCVRHSLKMKYVRIWHWHEIL